MPVYTTRSFSSSATESTPASSSSRQDSPIQLSASACEGNDGDTGGAESEVAFEVIVYVQVQGMGRV